MPLAANGDVWINWRAAGEGEPLLLIMGLNAGAAALPGKR